MEEREELRTDLDIGHFRRLLEEKRAAVLSREDEIRHQALEELAPEQVGEISSTRLHQADLASDTQEIDTLGALSEQNIRTLRKIDDALERIDNGIYGRCLSCNSPIEPLRLETVPETPLCQRCESLAEKDFNSELAARLPIE